jgi:regulatory protein
MKQWGRKKIQYALKEKMVNEESIQKAIKQIDETHYIEELKKLAKEKYSSLKNEQYLVRKKKTMDYLMQKGYEIELIRTFFETMDN